MVYSFKEARRIERTPRTETLTKYDAWGKPRTIKVTWRPLILWGIAPARENIGQVPVIWDVDCPVWLEMHRTNGSVVIKHDVRSVTFDHHEVHEAHRVDSLTAVKPGTYFIEEDV